MADPPPEIPAELQECMDAYLNKSIKPEKMTKNSTDDVLVRQSKLWRGRLAVYALEQDRMDVIQQIGDPDLRKILQTEGNCGGAHNIGHECGCGFGHCIVCHQWIPNTGGWGIRCAKPGCAPTNVCPPPKTIAPPIPVAPVPPPKTQAPVDPPAPDPPRKTAGKKARGQAKRAKKRGSGGGWGAPPTSSDESDGYTPTSPGYSPPGSPIPGLWKPIPKGGKKKKKDPAPSAPQTAAKKCNGVHGPTDICVECGQNFCKDCNQVRKGVLDGTKNYSCCGGGAPAVDLTAEEEKADILPADYPTHWEPPPPGVSLYTTRNVELDPDSQEFKDVIQHFHERNVVAKVLVDIAEGTRKSFEADYADQEYLHNPTGYVVKKVHAIRNFCQERMHDAFTRKIAAKNGVKPHEVLEIVYHGTKKDTAFDALALDSFNRDKSVQTRFGTGAYFDAHGPLSQFHAVVRCGNGKEGTIVVCSIASGKLAKTGSSDRGPPPGYDCGASDWHRGAWMRVSSHDAQVCPRYILTIERTAKPDQQ
jgi:hypothetical protein